MSIFKRHHQKVTIMYAINKGFTYAIRIFVAQFISRCNNNFHSWHNSVLFKLLVCEKHQQVITGEPSKVNKLKIIFLTKRAVFAPISILLWLSMGGAKYSSPKYPPHSLLVPMSKFCLTHSVAKWRITQFFETIRKS